METILFFMDLMGTLAFAVSGALTAVKRRMDVFGVTMLAIVTATGGGVIRDVMIGKLPPASFLDPFYVVVAAFTGLGVFLILYAHPAAPKKLKAMYNLLMICFDTLGIAAFTVDGVTVGLDQGFAENTFLLVFLGAITGVGGGMIRDILADQTPDIFYKHVYATAAVLGALVYAFLVKIGVSPQMGMLTGFVLIVALRVLAAWFHWNLPRIGEQKDR